MSTPAAVTVGVDLGGTGTRIVVVGRDGVVHRESNAPTAVGVTPAAASQELADHVAAAASGFTLEAVGVGASGPVDREGVIRNPDTLPAYSGIRLTDVVGERLGVRCVIDNDATTAAVGEHAYGAGRGSDALLVITLGTGIGVALLVGGRPVRAADGTHPEAGHIGVTGPAAPCYCGLPTCWEQLASRTALDQLTGGGAASLATAARAGDGAAAQVFDTYGSRVAAGLGTLLALIRPDRVVIGGGAARYLDLTMDAIQAGLSRTPTYTIRPEIRAAELGNMSGAVGAAVLARPSKRHRAG